MLVHTAVILSDVCLCLYPVRLQYDVHFLVSFVKYVGSKPTEEEIALSAARRNLHLTRMRTRPT